MAFTRRLSALLAALPKILAAPESTTQPVTFFRALSSEGGASQLEHKHLSSNRANPGSPKLNTAELSAGELKARKTLYVGMMGLTGLALIVGAAAVAVLKRGQLEVPYPALTIRSPSTGSVVSGCLSMLSLLGAAYLASAAASNPTWPAVSIAALLSLCSVAGLAKSLAGCFAVSMKAVVMKIEDLHRKLQSLCYPCLEAKRDDHEVLPPLDRSREDASRASLIHEEQVPEDRIGQGRHPSEGLDPSRAAFVGDEPPLADIFFVDEEQELERAIWSSRRRTVLLSLLAVYITSCLWLPWANRSSVSCSSGFFWEMHLVFFALFTLTKVVELVWYSVDDTLDGELSMVKFLVTFVPSFFGYADAYQDSTAIIIAEACANTSESSETVLWAGRLATSMLLTYVGGVVLLQWIVCGTLAAVLDPSGACLAKLLHMDAVAMCITVPADRLWLWYTVNAARTFGEDVLQAVQQTLFIVYVRKSYFMIISVVFSVICSLRALHDACVRVSAALGSYEKHLRLYWERKIHATNHTVTERQRDTVADSNGGADNADETQRNVVAVERGVVPEICSRILRGHPRADTYKKLLLRMFDDFQARRIVADSGEEGRLDVFIWVQPFDSDGRKGDPCVVHFDEAELIRQEMMNFQYIYEALSDRAARIYGNPEFAKGPSGETLAASRFDLPGAFWKVSNPLSSFKDLLRYEGVCAMLDSAPESDLRPYGNVSSVVTAMFGPGGIVPSLRSGGWGLRRHEKTPLLWGWYTLKGKQSKFNPLSAAQDHYPPQVSMKEMYEKYFGDPWPDDLAQRILGLKPKLQAMASRSNVELFPLVGLAHGDLHAGSFIIDSQDRVWVMDFVTACDLPLLTEVCKFELSCLFEHTIIPVTPKVFLEFASLEEAQWDQLKVGLWLRVDQAVAVSLLRSFAALGSDSLSKITQSDLDKFIDDSTERLAMPEQRTARNSLRARLCVDPSDMDAALSYCARVSDMLLQGDQVIQSLDVTCPAPPADRSSRGCSSLHYSAELVASARRLMATDLTSVLRDVAKTPEGLQPVDVLSVQLWLPILRESFRIIGYRDIAPQVKLWATYHCRRTADKLMEVLAFIEKNMGKLSSTDQVGKMFQDLALEKEASPS